MNLTERQQKWLHYKEATDRYRCQADTWMEIHEWLRQRSGEYYAADREEEAFMLKTLAKECCQKAEECLRLSIEEHKWQIKIEEEC